VSSALSVTPEEIRQELGAVLRGHREGQGRSLGEIAGEAGCSPAYLSEVERGRKDSSSEMLESICGAMDLRLSDLLLASSRTLRASSAHLARPTARPTGITSMAA
jgi:transcriptional regulator with XRE-family HTH domain